MSLVLCECPKCITYTRINEHGESTNGQMIHTSTRRKHWAKSEPESEEAALRALFPHLSITKPQSNAAPEPTSDADTSGDESEGLPEINNQTIIHFVMYFLAWLHLVCGVSQANCRIARDYIVAIAISITKSRTELDFEDDILNDVRSITKRMNLNPICITSHVCCPNCYSLYDIEYGPPECDYQERPTTKKCATELFVPAKFRQFPVILSVSTQKVRQAPAPRLKQPYSTFVVQSMKEWIKWFLSLDEIENALDDWAEKVRASPVTEVSDYQQSAAWKKLFPNQSNVNRRKGTPPSLELAFSLFIDWFNPLGNKISGRQVSIGLIALTCMNLPPEVRHQAQNTFLSGVVPAPGQPDMTTISHVLSPLVDELIELDRGFSIPTARYPKGRKVTIRLGCLIGDIVATHKVAGFTSHAGTFFCNWCTCSKDERPEMVIGRVRTKRAVLNAAHHWKECPTLTARDEALKATGVRWSELNRLDYWDPVNSVGLGMMHNWLEGVLQYHFRNRWRFENSKDTRDDIGVDGDNLEETEGGWLSGAMIHHILKNLREVVVPHGTTRIPTGLGTKANGKLKASEWHALFATHLPLAAIDVLIGDYDTFVRQESGRIHYNLLENFLALVECTHIIGSRTVSRSDCTRFGQVYQEYTRTSAEISAGVHIVPNHHYALHTPAQMAWFGPMLSISEFPGERLVGILQKMETNGRMDQTSKSYMTRFCQVQRLKRKCPPAEVIPKKGDGGLFELDNNTYAALLKYYQENEPSWCDYRLVEIPEGGKILKPYATEVKSMEGIGGFKFNNGQGNKLIEYTVNGVRTWGIVTHCLKVLLDDDVQFDLVVCVRQLQVVKNVRLDGILKRIGLVMLKDMSLHKFISAKMVTATRSYRMLPAWSLRV